MVGRLLNVLDPDDKTMYLTTLENADRGQIDQTPLRIFDIKSFDDVVQVRIRLHF